MHIFTSNNIIIQKFFKGYYRILKEIIIRMKSLTKKIIKVCKKLDFYGQYSLVDNIFLKYAQVASKDLSTYYSDLQNASASAKTIVADMFNILNKIRPEDITVFLNKFSKEDLTALVGDFINDLVILTNSYASDPSNKLVASAITTEQRNLYILPIFNQYFKSYPKAAFVIGYVVTEMLYHPVDLSAFTQATNFLDLYGDNATSQDPDDDFTNAVNYLGANGQLAIASLANEALKPLVSNAAESSIVTSFISTSEPDYKVMIDNLKVLFKSAPFSNLLASADDANTTAAPVDSSSGAAATPQQQACEQKLASLDNIDEGTLADLVNICDYITNGYADYPSFNQDLTTCGFYGGSGDPTKPPCTKAAQELLTLYNSIPDDYQNVMYDSEQATSTLGLTTSDTLTKLLEGNS